MWSTSSSQPFAARRDATLTWWMLHRRRRHHLRNLRDNRRPPAPDPRVLAVRLHTPGGGLVSELVAVPEPRGREVRIRVAGCGVCHTDLHIAGGEMTQVTLPITLGHEVSGWIDAFGPDAGPDLELAGLTTGDPVLVFGGWGCGECRECRSGDEQRCQAGRSPGFQVDGGYAEAMLVSQARHLVPLGTLDPVRAAPLADAGLTPYRAVRRAAPWLEPGARVLIVGFGGLGQFALQYLRRQSGLRVTVRDLNPDKTALAARMGADAVVRADAHESTEEPDSQQDVVFDFVGSDETLVDAARRLAPRGLLMIVGEGGGEIRFGFDAPALESWVTTSAWGSAEELREVVALAAEGDITWDVELMPLADAAIAHESLAAGQVRGRIVLVPPVNTSIARLAARAYNSRTITEWGHGSRTAS
jgi:alcohol dehydrogenase, propanol-preferring